MGSGLQNPQLALFLYDAMFGLNVPILIFVLCELLFPSLLASSFHGNKLFPGDILSIVSFVVLLYAVV